MKNLFFIIVFLLGLNYLKAQDLDLHGKDTILFIGNSKIGSEGGLHNHFQWSLKHAAKPLDFQVFWYPMYNRSTLGEMITPEVEKRAISGVDKYLIVQSGSEDEMTRMAKMVTKTSEMLIFGAWPDNPFLPDQSFETFAQEIKEKCNTWMTFQQRERIEVIPCGYIYYRLLQEPVNYPGLRPDYLFVPGSSVQNDLGTIVNVAATYAAMTGLSPVGLPVWDDFPPRLIRLLQTRVWELYREWKSGHLLFKDNVPNVNTPSRIPIAKKNHWTSLIKSGDRILYIGNSFIGTEGGLENHFPRVLKMIEPELDIQTKSMIFWGQGLSKMWTEEVRQEISTGAYDLVIVTSGPVQLLMQFKELISNAGSQMAVHMTWGRNPTINKEHMTGFEKETNSIVQEMKKFERENNIPVIPCGLIFYDLIADPPSGFSLRVDWPFMVENIHQNHLGTMANVAAHYAILVGRSPIGLPMWDPYPKKLVKKLQKRVWQLVQEWKHEKLSVQ